MEFDWLHDAAGWVSDFDWDPTTAVVFGGGAALGTWILTRLNVFATKRTDEWLDQRWKLHKGNQAKRSKEKVAKKKAEEHAALIRRTEAERVGRRFLVRQAKDDPGTVIEVVSLDPKLPFQSVSTRPVDDVDASSIFRPWYDLVRPAAEQMHQTARIEAKSPDDNDGYLWSEAVVD